MANAYYEHFDEQQRQYINAEVENFITKNNIDSLDLNLSAAKRSSIVVTPCRIYNHFYEKSSWDKKYLEKTTPDEFVKACSYIYIYLYIVNKAISDLFDKGFKALPASKVSIIPVRGLHFQSHGQAIAIDCSFRTEVKSLKGFCLKFNREIVTNLFTCFIELDVPYTFLIDNKTLKDILNQMYMYLEVDAVSRDGLSQLCAYAGTTYLKDIVPTIYRQIDDFIYNLK